MTNVSIFDKAVSAHAQWKGHLRESIETGESEWTVADVEVDDRCEFGKWLESLPASTKASDGYTHLRSLHTDFHKAASEVLELALAGKKEEASAAMSMGSRFSNTSTELVLTISQWKKSDTPQG